MLIIRLIRGIESLRSGIDAIVVDFAALGGGLGEGGRGGIDPRHGVYVEVKFEVLPHSDWSINGKEEVLKLDQSLIMEQYS